MYVYHTCTSSIYRLEFWNLMPVGNNDFLRLVAFTVLLELSEEIRLEHVSLNRSSIRLRHPFHS